MAEMINIYAGGLWLSDIDSVISSLPELETLAGKSVLTQAQEDSYAQQSPTSSYDGTNPAMTQSESSQQEETSQRYAKDSGNFTGVITSHSFSMTQQKQKFRDSMLTMSFTARATLILRQCHQNQLKQCSRTSSESMLY